MREAPRIEFGDFQEAIAERVWCGGTTRESSLSGAGEAQNWRFVLAPFLSCSPPVAGRASFQLALNKYSAAIANRTRAAPPAPSTPPPPSIYPIGLYLKPTNPLTLVP
jgi:hypothetical protein